jgi:hypothetical protein
MPTSLMKQVVRIFAVVWLILNEREVRMLWKSVVSKKRVRWELRMLLLRKCPAFREATAVLTPHRQHQRSEETYSLLTANQTAIQWLFTESFILEIPTTRSKHPHINNTYPKEYVSDGLGMMPGREKVLPPRSTMPLQQGLILPSKPHCSWCPSSRIR